MSALFLVFSPWSSSSRWVIIGIAGKVRWYWPWLLPQSPPSGFFSLPQYSSAAERQHIALITVSTLERRSNTARFACKLVGLHDRTLDSCCVGRQRARK